MFTKAIEIELQKLEDNNYEQSSRLRIHDGEMVYFRHYFVEEEMLKYFGGDEIEYFDDFDKTNTRKFLNVLGLAGKSADEIRAVLQEKFSQRPRKGEFTPVPENDFLDFCKAHGIEYKSSSWS
jgi:translation initiation factor 2 beta subunit (eIF-2beta)/eIF-5